MKGEDIFRALNDTDESLLEQSENYKEKKIIWKRIVPAAVCACAAICCVAAFLLSNRGHSVIETADSSSHIATSESEIKADNSNNEREEEKFSESTISHESAQLVPFDELEINQQFATLNYNGNEYSSAGKIDASYAGDLLGEATLDSVDYANDNKADKISAAAKVYTISGTDTNAALAVKFDENDSFYAYTNNSYNPSTLGEFATGLNLADTLTINCAYSDNFDENNNYVSMQYIGFNMKEVVNMLVESSSAQSVENFDSMIFDEKVMDFSVDLPAVSAFNLSFELTSDGYLVTNIMSTGRAYFIGQDNVEKISEYVMDNSEEKTIPSESVENTDELSILE